MSVEVLDPETIIEDLSRVASRFEAVAEAAESIKTAEFLTRFALLIRDLVAEHDAKGLRLCPTCLATSEWPCPTLVALISTVLPARLAGDDLEAEPDAVPEVVPDG